MHLYTSTTATLGASDAAMPNQKDLVKQSTETAALTEAPVFNVRTYTQLKMKQAHLDAHHEALWCALPLCKSRANFMQASLYTSLSQASSCHSR
jgi:hypothetical protein